jgi:tight adherence protein B
MDQSTLLILYGVIFLGVLMAVQGLVDLVADSRTNSRSVNTRLRMLAAGADPEQVMRQLRRSAESIGLARFQLLQSFRRLALHSGVRAPMGALVAGMLFASGALSLLLRPMMGMPLAWPVAFVCSIVAMIVFLRGRRKRRLRLIAAPLPDAIDLLVRSIRAGQPLNAALRIAAREVRDPLGSEIGLLVDEVTYGKSLPEAAMAMSERIGLEEVDYLVVAIKVQHSSGGNIAELLTALARVIRERATMVQKIRAVSAEGRLSAAVLSAFPLVLAGLLQLTSPSFFGDVADDPLFLPLAGFVLFMMLLNIIVTRRLVNFDF